MGNSQTKILSNETFRPLTPRSNKKIPQIKTYNSNCALSTDPEEFSLTSPTSKLNGSRRLSVSKYVDLDAPNAKLVKRVKNEKDSEMIRKTLSQHFIFTHLPIEDLERIVSQMKLFSLKANEPVFFQGNPGGKFFIIAQGSVQIIINGSVKGNLGAGQGFGELALIHDTKRTATIKTLEYVEMWAIERQVFRDSLKAINSLKFEENKTFLRSVPFLQTLTEDQIETLLPKGVSQSFTHGQKIISEGDPGSIFYIIQEGSVECSSSGKVFRRLTKGEYFGEQAVLYNSNRTATVTSVNKVKVLSFGREILTSAIGQHLNYILYQNSLRIAFDSCEYLKGLTSKQKEEIIKKVEIFQFSQSETVIPKGAVKNRYLWIVVKGSISAMFKGVQKFQNVGAKWMHNLKDEMIKENYVADNEVDVGIIKTSEIEGIIGGKLADKVQENYIVEILKKVQMFRMISESKLTQLANKLKTAEFSENQIIFTQGEPGDSFYILKDGVVNISKDSKVIRTIFKGNYFGERSILLNETRTASAFSMTKTSLWVLSREDFLEIVDEKILTLLKKRMHLQDDSTSLSDLVIVKRLGKGTFGNVYLCVKKQTKFLYALKTISKRKIEMYGLHECMKVEKKTMQIVEHQFIVKFVKSFVDSKRVYFLLEYIQGVSFHEVLRNIGYLGTSRCKFYACCLLLIIEHLHEIFIVYRDLKPENIMVEADGYLKLLDFGTAKCIDSKTYTVIGTPHYTAPEVILGRGYTKSSDLWSFGIILYEMLCGSVPFGENEEDPITIYREIIQSKLNYPSFVTQDSKDLIGLLLSKTASIRGSASSIKGNKWFVGVDWDNILNRVKNSPYKPNIDVFDELVGSCIEQNTAVESYFSQHREDSELLAKDWTDKSICNDWDEEF